MGQGQGRLRMSLVRTGESLVTTLSVTVLDRGDRAAVDRELRTMNGGGAIRGEEGDEFRHFLGLRRTSERDPAKGIDDGLTRGVFVQIGREGDPLYQRLRCAGVDPTRGDDIHPHAAWAHLFRKRLAVRDQRRFRRRIGRGRIVQRQLALDRSGVDDDVRP